MRADDVRELNLRYKSAFPNNPQLILGMAGAYDATYMIAYSIASIDKGAVTGEAIATNFKNLITGAPINVGPTQLNTAYATLTGGGTIDFNGASGPLNFNLATGEAPSDITVWCLGVDPNTNKTIFNDSTGETYNATSNQLSGTFSCQ